MFVVFYTIKIMYICVFMTCSTSYILKIINEKETNLHYCAHIS